VTVPSSDGSLGAELRPLMLSAVLLRRWRWSIVFPVLATIGTAILVFVIPSRYTSRTIFVPESRTSSSLSGSLAGLAGLASLAGVGGGGGTQSPKFYADFIGTETVSEAILSRPITSIPGPRGRPLTLLEFLHKGGKNRPDSLYMARELLDDRVKTEVNRETGTVTLSVTLADPRVAAEVTGWYLEELDRFNAKRRQSTAHARRQFLEGRIAELEGEQRKAEDALRKFYEANRQYESAPSLVFEARRLQTRVDQLTEVIGNVQRDFENARIEEVNDTPVITVIDQPSVPARRSFPKRKLFVLLAAIVSLGVGAGIAYLAEAVRQWNRRDVEGQSDLTAAWAEARRGLGRVLPVRSRRPPA
jgi:uncharacterized protein involved in exopolysaccharide biosynthesis